MPTQRWQKLAPEKQAAILRVAREEFARHGFEGASYNRIIDRSRSSKGAMYYYFEDKGDLYATVVRDSVERYLAFVGPPPSIETAAAFWAEAERITEVSFRFYREDPEALGLARALIRDVLSGEGRAATSVLAARALIRASYQAMLELGIRVGAVREDLPPELVLAVASALSEAVDLWYAERADELTPADLEHLVPRIADLYRRIAEPRPLAPLRTGQEEP